MSSDTVMLLLTLALLVTAIVLAMIDIVLTIYLLRKSHKVMRANEILEKEKEDLQDILVLLADVYTIEDHNRVRMRIEKKIQADPKNAYWHKIANLMDCKVVSRTKSK